MFSWFLRTIQRGVLRSLRIWDACWLTARISDASITVKTTNELANLTISLLLLKRHSGRVIVNMHNKNTTKIHTNVHHCLVSFDLALSYEGIVYCC